MKKILLSLCLLVFGCIFLLSGCDPKLAADKADNVKKVTASYLINNAVNSSKDNLLKSAELIYTSMNIVSSEEIKASAVEVDLKLSTSQTETLYCIVFYADSESNETMKMLTDTVSVALNGDFSTVTFTFNETVNLTATSEKDLTDETSIVINFYENAEAKVNSNIVFSINNVKLIEAK